MIINQKFSANLPQQIVANVTSYLVTPDFKQYILEPFTSNLKRRFLTPMTSFGQIIAIQHSGWFTKSSLPTYMMTLQCVATLGLLDVMLLSHEGTYDTALIWLMVPKAHIYKSSDIGVVVASGVPNPKDKVHSLSMSDDLYYMADQRFVSTAVVLSNAYSFDTY